MRIPQDVGSKLKDLLKLPYGKEYLTMGDILSNLSQLLQPIVLWSTISMMEVATKNLYYSILEMPYLALLSSQVLANFQNLLSK